MTNREISTYDATKLLKEKGGVFIELFKHGNLIIDFYKPEKLTNNNHTTEMKYMLLPQEQEFSIMGAISGNLNQETSYLFQQGLNIGL